MPWWLFSPCIVSDFFVTPWTVALQAPLSMGLPRQEYWSGLPRTPAGDLPNSGMEPASPAWQAGSLPLSHLGTPLYEDSSHIGLGTAGSSMISIICKDPISYYGHIHSSWRRGHNSAHHRAKPERVRLHCKPTGDTASRESRQGREGGT